MPRTLVVVTRCWLALSCSLLVATAANTPEKSDQSEFQLVQEVLQSEPISTNNECNRRTILKPESRPDSDPDSLWWQAGYVKTPKGWKPYEDSIGVDAAKLKEYQSRRAAFSGHANGNWKLSNWCRKNGLFAQERVHLMQALASRETAIDVRAAYERLGCRQVGNSWVSPRERLDAERATEEIERSFKHWGTRMDSLVSNLKGTVSQKTHAEKLLSEIDDPSSVPVIVSRLCLANESLADAGIRTLDHIEGYQASRALAGQAVLSPWRRIRSQATGYLKRRKLEDFVPDLLMLLSTTIRTNTEFSTQRIFETRASYRVDWDYCWVDETRDTVRIGIRRLMPVDGPTEVTAIFSEQCPEITGLHDTGGRGRFGNGRLTTLELLFQADDLDYAAEVVNDTRRDVNERVGKVLAEVGDQPMSSDPKIWWNWWDRFLSVSSPQKNVIIVDERKGQPDNPSFVVNWFQWSCLVAGTPIWTEKGFVAIETLQPGDQVLSKDIHSGELSYKPITQVTVREPTPVVKLHFDDDAVEASAGHHFWVSGEGWAKTRQLNPDQPIHTATGMQRVRKIEDEGRTAQVYNLVVADTHTYFVGKAMILSHDVLLPSPTNIKVPGLGTP